MRDNNRRATEPSTTESTATDHGGYGLSTPRDENNELLPVEHTFPFDGEYDDDVDEWVESPEWVTIRLIPPTLSQLKEYRELGEDVQEDEDADDAELIEKDDDHLDDFKNIIDRHVIEPAIPADDMTIREINCYISGVVDYGKNGGGARMERRRQQLANENSGQGN